MHLSFIWLQKSELKATTEYYHGKVEDATNWTQAAGLSDETLRPCHWADITSGHKDLDAHGLPLSNTLGLITCQDNKRFSVLHWPTSVLL